MIISVVLVNSQEAVHHVEGLDISQLTSVQCFLQRLPSERLGMRVVALSTNRQT